MAVGPCSGISLLLASETSALQVSLRSKRGHGGRHSRRTESDPISDLKRAFELAKAGQHSPLVSIQNNSGLSQGFLRTLRGRLSLQQTRLHGPSAG
jgi:hypothetical protein